MDKRNYKYNAIGINISLNITMSFMLIFLNNNCRFRILLLLPIISEEKY